MSGFVAGQKVTTSDSADHIISLKDGLDFLRPSNDGIDLLKRLGWDGFETPNTKFEWAETSLAARQEVITIDGASTALTVLNAKQYAVNEVLLVDDEAMRVVTVAPGGVATALTVQRGVAGSVAAAHTAKQMFSMGTADPEGAKAPEGIADTGDRYFNYIQTFTRAVELSNDEIAQASSGGNPLVGQTERRYIELMQQVARTLFYGKRYEDTSGAKAIRYTGGMKTFVTSNVQNVGGALSIASIDQQILNIATAGGDPKLLVLSPYQKQKLDALDNNKQLLGKKEHTGGGLITNTWQSGVINHEVDILVDQSMRADEMWILDTDQIKVGTLQGNGVNGHFHVEDASIAGDDAKKKVIRGKVGFRVENQKANAYLYGLS